MKKINFANFVSIRNNWLKRHLMLLVIFLSVLSGMNAQQIIGSFPYMNGGFEGQAAGALSTTLSPTNWTKQGSALNSTIVTSSPRTGLNYATTTTSGQSTTTNRILQSPQLQPYDAAANPTAGTDYVFQYWVRNASSVAGHQVGVSTDGITNSKYSTTGTLAANATWTKITTAVKTNSTTQVTTSAVLVLKSTTGTFDVDDIVIYTGTTADVTAPDPVTSPSAPTSAATQMTVSWSAPGTGVDGGGYMVVRGSSDPTTTPNANGIYAVGNFVAGAEKVVYLGTNNSYTDLSLSPSTTYYYRIYTVDKAFNYSSAVSISGTTASPSFDAEPTSQASSISFANVSSTGFDINWTKGNGTNSLVVIHSGSAVNADPVDGSTYTANTAMGSGSQIGTGNYVVYTGSGSTVTVTGLTKFTTYYVNVYTFNGTTGIENYLTTSPATGNQLTLRGEISSTGNNSGGSSWATAASWVGNVVPGLNDNVTIAAGDKILVASSQSCYNLTIPATAKVYNNTALPTSSLSYLTVYGTSLICNGTLGDKITSGLSDGALGINFNNNMTISGSGLLRPARIRPNSGVSNLTLTVDADMEILYNGASGTGGAGMYTDNGGDNITIIVNAGRTLNFASGSNFNSNATSITNGAANTTITINGTVNANANFSMPIVSGKTYSLTVNGALNVGNLNATSSTGGGIPTVSVGPAGSITVSGTADFSITSLSAYVGGTGTFTLNSGGTINIAAANGLESTAGPIRTTTRNFNSAANYTYLGAVAQLTGSDMPATVNTLTITNPAGVTLSSNTTATTLTNSTSSILNVPAAKQLTVSSTMTNNGTLNLLSDNTNGTATLLTPETIAGTGTTNVQQYLTAGRNWYVSSPVSGATAAVFDPAGLSNILYSYDETHGSTAPWPAITENAIGLTVMNGYVANMASSGVVTFSGSLNTGAKSIDVSRTTGQTKEGFNLVGNPYPSYLDWDNVTKNNLLTTLWYRTKTTPAPVTGATTWIFDTYNSTGKLGTSLGAKTVTNLIPPMQAFWVRVNEGQTSGTFSVTNDQRAHADNSSNGFKSRLSTASTQSVLRLEVSNGLTRDQALVYFNANASNSYDSYDSPKMSNETVSIPEIYTLAGSEQVVINGVNNLTQLTLGFSTGEANQFTIKASQFTNFVSGTQIVLRDNLLNYEQDLTLGDYNFYSDITANNESRFTVLFKAPSVATGINQNSSANGWISQNANNQIVVNGASAESIVAVYNEIGQRLMSQRLTSTTKALGAFVPGVYMVTVSNAGKSATTKVIIK